MASPAQVLLDLFQKQQVQYQWHPNIIFFSFQKASKKLSSEGLQSPKPVCFFFKGFVGVSPKSSSFSSSKPGVFHLILLGVFFKTW